MTAAAKRGLTTRHPWIIFALQSEVGCPARTRRHELRDALSQIAEIRMRMAETEVFRGYRSLPAAFSGVLAVIAAFVQPFWVADPGRDSWVLRPLDRGCGVSVAGAGMAMLLRDRFGGCSQTREITLLAVSQLLPSFAAGAVVTAVIVRKLPEAAGLMPGLWQVLLSLGLFASCRLLPRTVFWVALFYLLSGAATLAWLAANGCLTLGRWACHSASGN